MKGEGFSAFLPYNLSFVASLLILHLHVFRQQLSDVRPKPSDVRPKPSDAHQKVSDGTHTVVYIRAFKTSCICACKCIIGKPTIVPL